MAPGYTMADAVATQLTGGEASFTGADMSTKLKLIGTDVASFGNIETKEPHKNITITAPHSGVYKRLILTEHGKFLSEGEMACLSTYPVKRENGTVYVQERGRLAPVSYDCETHVGGSATHLQTFGPATESAIEVIQRLRATAAERIDEQTTDRAFFAKKNDRLLAIVRESALQNSFGGKMLRAWNRAFGELFLRTKINQPERLPDGLTLTQCIDRATVLRKHTICRLNHLRRTNAR